MALVARSREIFQSLKAGFNRCRHFCSSCILVLCFILLVLSLTAVILRPPSVAIHVVVVDSDKPILYETDIRFVSVALDSSLIADDFRGFNMTNPWLLSLMTPLAPGYLRIGGTMADRLWFTPGNTMKFKAALDEVDGGECSNERHYYCNQHLKPNFTMSEIEWLQLNSLASKAGFIVLFDLNCLVRHKNGSWNSKNAEELIAFSNRHRLRVIWELGNEPNAFKHVFNYEVNASQLSQDFITLRKVLSRYPLYNDSLLVGPDTTRPLVTKRESEFYLATFLQHGSNVIDAVTWHQYYFNGRTALSVDFINPFVFDVLKEQIEIIKDIVSNSDAKLKPIWLGETGSAYGGGAPGFSDRYIATFIWLDKLGVAARYGLKVVIRQSLFRGYYALINNVLDPTPDWWVTVIYKSLVSRKVVPCSAMTSIMVRLYCQCAKRNDVYGTVPSVIVYGMNMKSTEAKVRLEGLIPGSYDVGTKVFAYILTPHFSLLSKYIKLNDGILQLLPNGSLPEFVPILLNSKPFLVMPPYSLVFWVIPSPVLRYC